MLDSHYSYAETNESYGNAKNSLSFITVEFNLKYELYGPNGPYIVSKDF